MEDTVLAELEDRVKQSGELDYRGTEQDPHYQVVAWSKRAINPQQTTQKVTIQVGVTDDTVGFYNQSIPDFTADRSTIEDVLNGDADEDPIGEFMDQLEQRMVELHETFSDTSNPSTPSP